MKTLYVDMNALASQTKEMALQCVEDGVRPEWYEGLAGMLAEIEYALSRSGEVMLKLATSEGAEM